jgi:high affinity sulfate transporter 1
MSWPTEGKGRLSGSAVGVLRPIPSDTHDPGPMVPPNRAEIGRLAAWVPGLQLLHTYRLPWLRHDLMAGLTLSAVLVPAGMGYAQAAGLPAITGLYATIVPLIMYAIFGPSRILVLGPDAALIPLIAGTVLPLASGDLNRAVALAGILAVLSGAICMTGALARLGFITELLSKPVRYGYLNGIALTLIVSQLPTLCGFSVNSEGLGPQISAFVRGVAQGQTELAAVIIGTGCIALILGSRAWVPRAPGMLLAVVLATIVVGAFGLSSVLKVVGVLPAGLPRPTIPAVSISDLGLVGTAALAMSLISFADTSIVSRTFAIRGGYEVRPTAELFALGVANVATGFFQGFPISSSSSRTPVAEASGAKTQLTGVVGAVTVSLLLVIAPGLLGNLPTAALAAVVISAAVGLFEISGVRILYQVRRSEFLLSMASLLGVALLGVLPGIGVAVGLSLLDFIRHAWRPHDAVLGRVEGLKGYHDLARHPEGRQIPGLVLFRWDAPLFFANADLFRDRIRQRLAAASSPTNWLIIAAEPVTDVDSTAAECSIRSRPNSRLSESSSVSRR